MASSSTHEETAESVDGRKFCLLKDAPPGENSLGAPVVEFVPNIGELLENCSDHMMQQLITECRIAIEKFSLLTTNVAEKRVKYQKSLVKFQKSLDVINCVVSHRNENQTMETYSAVKDDLLERASVPSTGKVLLRLGAEVFAEYTDEQAQKVLVNKINGLQKELKRCAKDVNFLGKQISVLEIIISQAYNRGIGTKHKNKDIE